MLKTKATLSTEMLALRNYVGEKTWASWFAALQFQKTSTGSALLVPSQFTADWITNNYGSVLRKLQITVVITRAYKRADNPMPTAVKASGSQQHVGLNHDMTFENFVVGTTNHFAFEVAMRLDCDLADLPYTTLFINGKSGVGKTHLLNALGWGMVQRGLKITYLSSDQFLRKFVDAVRERSVNNFVNEILATDGFLLDDFQFLVGKERTQEQFFSILNSITNAGKIMIVTSDQSPSEFVELDERMRSRLGGGMTATIEPPDYELKLALLQSWRPDLSHSVLDLLAGLNISIRELKGALMRLTVQASCYKAEITTEFVQSALRDLFSVRGPALTVNEVLDAVVEYAQKNMMKITKDAIRAGGRTAVMSEMRQVFMYLAHELATATPAAIGRFLNNRNRTTVRHGIIKMRERMCADVRLSGIVREIKTLLCV